MKTWYYEEARAIANRDLLLNTIEHNRKFGDWETRKERAADPLEPLVSDPGEEDDMERGRR
jgi:hypothetical protein